MAYVTHPRRCGCVRARAYRRAVPPVLDSAALLFAAMVATAILAALAAGGS